MLLARHRVGRLAVAHTVNSLALVAGFAALVRSGRCSLLPVWLGILGLNMVRCVEFGLLNVAEHRRRAREWRVRDALRKRLRDLSHSVHWGRPGSAPPPLEGLA